MQDLQIDVFSIFLVSFLSLSQLCCWCWALSQMGSNQASHTCMETAPKVANIEFLWNLLGGVHFEKVQPTIPTDEHADSQGVA